MDMSNKKEMNKLLTATALRTYKLFYLLLALEVLLVLLVVRVVERLMPETICLFNQKGGSGKSTSTILLALGIAEMTKHKVGILDRDPQQTATRLHAKLREGQTPTPEKEWAC